MLWMLNSGTVTTQKSQDSRKMLLWVMQQHGGGNMNGSASQIWVPPSLWVTTNSSAC